MRSHVVGPVRQVRRLVARVALDEGTDLGTLYRDAARGVEGDAWVLRSAGTATARAGAPESGEESRRLETRLAGIWCTVLGRDRVGRDDNFFGLGGNSLLLLGAQAAINEELGCDLGVVDLFAHPTVRALARHLADSAVGAGHATAAPAPDRPTGLDRARQQAQRQRAARDARRSVRERKDRNDG